MGNNNGDPENRTLYQVTVTDAVRADNTFSTLMGDNPALRREWIEENVNFDIVE